MAQNGEPINDGATQVVANMDCDVPKYSILPLLLLPVLSLPGRLSFKFSTPCLLTLGLSRYELVNTPSRVAGVSAELERDVRRLGCEMIQSCGIILGCSQVFIIQP